MAVGLLRQTTAGLFLLNPTKFHGVVNARYESGIARSASLEPRHGVYARLGHSWGDLHAAAS